jgi:hypothetical protein
MTYVLFGLIVLLWLTSAFAYISEALRNRELERNSYRDDACIQRQLDANDEANLELDAAVEIIAGFLPVTAEDTERDDEERRYLAARMRIAAEVARYKHRGQRID